MLVLIKKMGVVDQLIDQTSTVDTLMLNAVCLMVDLIDQHLKSAYLMFINNPRFMSCEIIHFKITLTPRPRRG